VNLDTLIRQLSNKLEKTIRQINNASLKYNIQNRTRNFSTQTKNHIKNIMNKQSSFKGLRYIRNPDDPDAMITDPPLIKTCIRNFYATLFDEHDSNPPLGNSQHWFRPLTSITSQDMEMLAYPITKDELDSIIKNSGHCRAPGPDTITYEYFKCLSPEGSARKFILVLFNYLLHFAISPSELGRAIIILLQKTDGEWNGDPAKLRPITLLETTRKLFTGILNTRLQYKIEKHNLLLGYNFGFKPGHSTNNNLTITRLLIDHAKLHKNTLFIALLDIQKAYDTVPFPLIRHALLHLRKPYTITVLLE
jgi:hypothetical protein